MSDKIRARNMGVECPPNAVRCPGCFHPVVAVRPYLDVHGIGTVRSSGAFCCSEFEGEFTTYAMAEEQCVITRAYIGLPPKAPIATATV